MNVKCIVHFGLSAIEPEPCGFECVRTEVEVQEIRVYLKQYRRVQLDLLDYLNPNPDMMEMQDQMEYDDL